MRSVWSRVATGSMTVVTPPLLSAGKQNGRLDLRRGDRHAVFDRHQRLRSAHGRRQAVAGAGDDLDAHAAQRIEHAAHRPPDQRGVAGEGGGEGVAAGDAQRQADAGAGIAVVDDALGLEQAADAEPVDPPGAGAGAGDGRAEGAHGGDRGEDVVALEQALDAGLADGERPQHEGAVGNRLVARRPDGAGERPRRPASAAPRLVARHVVGIALTCCPRPRRPPTACRRRGPARQPGRSRAPSG